MKGYLKRRPFPLFRAPRTRI